MNDSYDDRHEILREVREMRSDLRVLNTKMFGADESELPQGRVPRLEAAVVDYDERIARLERFRWAAQGIAWLSGALSGALAFWYHFLHIGGRS